MQIRLKCGGAVIGCVEKIIFINVNGAEIKCQLKKKEQDKGCIAQDLNHVGS